ncbi:3-dehydroquinate dehydratase (3-dehydroquinase) [Coemansia sp. RSA 1365]|nr:3-dehydroquinate dehydratase (3-dehydroquinase) [Coemansia sp. RSA 1365]
MSASSDAQTTPRPLRLAEVEVIPVLGQDSIVCGFHLVDYIWKDIFENLKAASTYVLITDTNLLALYVEKYKEAFAAAWQHHKPSVAAPRLLIYTLQPGETSKSRATKGAIEDWMLEQKCTRDTMVLALGGGVIGDLVGFVAATFMRGVPFVQIPTSLLAMVDSSIGGKTAVDTPAGKNLIGAFWQPQRIFMDMAVLSTLPEREFSNGMAEVVKTAAIWLPEEFEVLESRADDIRTAVLEGQKDSGSAGLTKATRTVAQGLLLRVIAASARVKAHVVTHDERELGMRGLLNFGHTIGHAIEAILSPQVLHGECVAVGCVLEAEVARRMGHLGEVSVKRLARCLAAYGLPTAMDDPIIRRRAGDAKLAEVRPARLMQVMRVDKKNIGTQKRLVLLKRLGQTLEMKPTNVDDALIEATMSKGMLVGPLAAEAAAATVETVVVPPGSKSISNRALQLAALGQGECRIKNLLHSDDTQVMLAALQAMDGCSFRWEDDGDTLVVVGGGGRLRVADQELYLGNAGTASRFLTTTVNLIDASEGSTVVTGNARMRQRPAGPLVDALRTNGCVIEYCEREGSLPLRITHTGRGFPGGHIQLAASVSSQYVSSILLCAPYAQEAVRLELVGGKVISQPYIDMTIAMMEQFGCHVERVAENEYVIPRGAYINPAEYVVESDASSATYPLAFAAITGTQCTVPSIGSSSLQGDARFAVEVLRPMGCTVEQTATATTVRGPARGGLKALDEIDMEPMTDAFLTAAVLAAVAAAASNRTTRIRGIANQHVKECDRIEAMCTELAKFGVTTENHADGIDVHARQISELNAEIPTVYCYDDHRVAMSLSLLACVAPGGAVIEERRCVGKTWPQWWDVLARDLGAPTIGADTGATPTEAASGPTTQTQGMSVVLIGMRGVGKTTLGQAAARELGLEFVDLDDLLERDVGQTIPEIINRSGWPTFREHETRVLAGALSGELSRGAIIACGGGVVESETNRTLLKAYTGPVICLTPNMEHVAEYLSHDKLRPAYAITSDIHDFATADLADDKTGTEFVSHVHRQFTLLRHSSRLPVIFTVRTQPQGGRFPVDAVELRLRLLRNAVQWGSEYVDVEVDDHATQIYSVRGNSLVIASFHDPIGTRLRWKAGEDEFALEMLGRARACGDIAKLISTARDWEDNSACHAFVQRHHSPSTPLIALNMGYVGQMSRVLCPCLTPVTHSLLSVASAPGQISAKQINEARALIGLLPAQRFYLFGTPIQQSPSPAMHNAAFAALGLPHSYELKETPTVDALVPVLAAENFGGASVTIPHKQAIIPLLDSLTPAAERIGAVNTIIPVVEGVQRQLVGDNTDYLGIVGCLRQAQFECSASSFTASTALVIGAGGTSRAALYALYTLGVRYVLIFNRTEARAQELAQEFAPLFEKLSTITQLEDAAASAPAYIIGTIPASDIYLPDALFSGVGVALDMAYKPRWTPLLEAASRRKWAVVHGVAVLIEQGIHQLEKWTHSVAPAKYMGDAVHSKYNMDF